MPDVIYERAAMGQPAVKAFAVTPNDNTDLTVVASFLRIGTAGNIVVTPEVGDDVTINNCLAGETIWLRIRRVKSTNTTASNITAFA